jgi:hypothetical protein
MASQNGKAKRERHEEEDREVLAWMVQNYAESGSSRRARDIAKLSNISARRVARALKRFEGSSIVVDSAPRAGGYVYRPSRQTLRAEVLRLRDRIACLERENNYLRKHVEEPFAF